MVMGMRNSQETCFKHDEPSLKTVICSKQDKWEAQEDITENYKRSDNQSDSKELLERARKGTADFSITGVP